MKAFEKWLKEDSVKTGFLYDEVAEKERKKGWRGALEYALKLESGSARSVDMASSIRKELEED